MCKVKSREKTTTNKPKKSTMVSEKKWWTDEPHLTLSEKLQHIQGTERPTGALVAAGSLWPPCLIPSPTYRQN